MRTKSICLLSAALLSKAIAGECPGISEAQAILNRCLKAPLTVKTVEEVRDFPVCKVTTQEGETFFLSMNRKHLIEGILIEIPPLVLSSEDYQILKKNILSSVGEGTEIIVATNPLCRACREHREKIKQLTKKFKVSFVMAGFNREEINAAVDAVCRKKNFSNLFDTEKSLEICDSGKLKVWTVSDTLKKYGITGTPVFVFPDGKVAVGIDDFESMLESAE
jgi:thiol:disulfide interchange protein DsbC